MVFSLIFESLSSTFLEDISIIENDFYEILKEQDLLNSLKQIENNYSDISKQSKLEDELIDKKKNKSEKLNFVFTQEEVIR